MRVRYTLQAKATLEDIFTYIALDNPVAARRVITAIRRDTYLLTNNPEIGRRGRIDGTRELVISRLPYIAAYRVEDGFIDVLAVIHTARDWPGSL